MRPLSIWIGFDPREAVCFGACRFAIRRILTQPIPIRGVVLSELQRLGLYRRPTTKFGGQLWDIISKAPMSTEFAISRFLVPHLAGEGLALFMDCDMLPRVNLLQAFELTRRDPGRAVWCVKHDHRPSSDKKMDGQEQTTYERKNWSSFMIFDCDHPAVRELTPDLVNQARGLDLHQFKWLESELIGALPARFNYLVGHTNLEAGETPAVVHWTDGAPCFPGYEYAEYAEEFHAEVRRWAS